MLYLFLFLLRVAPSSRLQSLPNWAYGYPPIHQFTQLIVSNQKTVLDFYILPEVASSRHEFLLHEVVRVVRFLRRQNVPNRV